jgi:fructose-1,6-bisphosphatase/sedoheptulose 1,7-bisphosphatase-like protein
MAEQWVFDIEQKLSLGLVRVVEEAAAARTMGQGDRDGADHAAVQAMRRAFEDVPIAGTTSSARANATRRPCCTSVNR